MSEIISFWAFITISAITPGPNNCMALSHAVRSLRSGLLFSVGVFGGMLIVMLACGLMSGLLLQHLKDSAMYLKWLGSAYMFWLAWSLWCDSSVSDLAAQKSGKLMFTGCLLQLINPKLIAYGMTAFSVFLLPHGAGQLKYGAYAVLLALVGFLGTLTWAICGAALKNLFQQHPVMINRILAVMVLLCAVSVWF